MNATAQKTAAWYTRMLMPLERNINLTIISRLSSSLVENEAAKTDSGFFNGLTDAWDDGVSPEVETAAIRAARTQGITRVLEDF